MFTSEISKLVYFSYNDNWRWVLRWEDRWVDRQWVRKVIKWKDGINGQCYCRAAGTLGSEEVDSGVRYIFIVLAVEDDKNVPPAHPGVARVLPL